MGFNESNGNAFRIGGSVECKRVESTGARVGDRNYNEWGFDEYDGETRRRSETKQNEMRRAFLVISSANVRVIRK
jgi:hypothetical protein